MFEKIIDKKYKFFISIKQINELKRVINYPKFKFTEHQKNKFLEIIFEVATIIDTKSEIDIVRDKTDNIHLECALEAKADYIISGDEDLKVLKEFQGIKILSVKEFLDLTSTK